MATIIDQDVLDVLETMECSGGEARLNCGTLARPQYVRVNKVLEALGGKWDRKAKAHLFDGDAAELLGDVVSTGEYIDHKKKLGFFETPPDLADELVTRLGTSNGPLAKDCQWLEPSAGNGALARAMIRVGFDPNKGVLNELDAGRADTLREATGTWLVHNHDFLTMWMPVLDRAPGLFDAIVMNPPFAKSQDIDHVMHAYRLLAKNGVLAAIMSAGFTFRQDKKAKAFLGLVGTDGEWEPNKPDAFKASGTMVRTVMVTLYR